MPVGRSRRTGWGTTSVIHYVALPPRRWGQDERLLTPAATLPLAVGGAVAAPALYAAFAGVAGGGDSKALLDGSAPGSLEVAHDCKDFKIAHIILSLSKGKREDDGQGLFDFPCIFAFTLPNAISL